MPRIFPSAGVENRVIGVSASESRSGYSVLMADVVPSLHAADMVGSQFFPLYLYDGSDSEADEDDTQSTLFAAPKKTPGGTARRDGITDAGLAHFQSAYPRRDDHEGGRLLLRLRHPPLGRLPRALRRQPRQGAAAHPAREDGRGLLGLQPRRPRARRPPRRLRARARAPRAHRRPCQAHGRAVPRREDEVRQGQGQERHPLQRLHHRPRHPPRRLRLRGQRQARDRVGDGAPERHHRQGQRHRQGRERLGHRDRRRPALPALAPPARDHRQPRDDEDRSGAAGARHPRGARRRSRSQGPPVPPGHAEARRALQDVRPLVDLQQAAGAWRAREGGRRGETRTSSG